MRRVFKRRPSSWTFLLLISAKRGGQILKIILNTFRIFLLSFSIVVSRYLSTFRFVPFASTRRENCPPPLISPRANFHREGQTSLEPIGRTEIERDVDERVSRAFSPFMYIYIYTHRRARISLHSRSSRRISCISLNRINLVAGSSLDLETVDYG